jgi:hypothetical protein
VSDYQKAIDNHTLFGANGRFADRRKEARKGDRARLLKNEEIVQRAGLNVAYYTTIWRMLSSHVHAHPDAISSLETFSASDPDSAISLGLIVRFAVAYGSWAALEFEKHFPGLLHRIRGRRSRTRRAQCSYAPGRPGLHIIPMRTHRADA